MAALQLLFFMGFVFSPQSIVAGLNIPVQKPLISRHAGV
jgi:hypothetical protein